MMPNVKVGWFVRFRPEHPIYKVWGVVDRIMHETIKDPAMEVRFPPVYGGKTFVWLSQVEVAEHIGPTDCIF